MENYAATIMLKNSSVVKPQLIIRKTLKQVEDFLKNNSVTENEYFISFHKVFVSGDEIFNVEVSN